MMRSRRSHAPRSPRRAALFVDYANLHALLGERLDAPDCAGEYITEAISEMRRYLTDEDQTDTVLTAAYADFSALEGSKDLQEKLYYRGVEPRFVPAAEGDRTVEIQLSVDATALLHRRPDVTTFALVTGDRTFLPLVQALQRQGAHAVVAALDPPPSGAYAHDDVFMDFLNLLSDAARRDLLQGGEIPARREAAAPSTASAASQYDRLDDEMLFRTLEVTDEHFGQYDEVYLTPLLRKLSDVLGERFDPKALVSGLEDAGAVRLAKRRGYPYDYTVLIVNRDHPDVQDVEEEFYAGASSPYERATPSGYDRSDDGRESAGDEDDYDEDDYDEDDYDEDDYDEGDYDEGDYEESTCQDADYENDESDRHPY